MSSLDKIKIIMSQTDYSEEKATEKLHEWNDDYMNVIREYLNPKFQEKKPKKLKFEDNISFLVVVLFFLFNLYSLFFVFTLLFESNKLE